MVASLRPSVVTEQDVVPKAVRKNRIIKPDTVNRQAHK